MNSNKNLIDKDNQNKLDLICPFCKEINYGDKSAVDNLANLGVDFFRVTCSKYETIFYYLTKSNEVVKEL